MSAIGERQSAAIARIELALADGTPGQGTGFAVARDRILTAWHVMSQGTGHRAFFGGKGPRVELGAAKSVPPSHANRDDWVLVECKVPADIEPLELAPLVVKEGAWRSRGFPIGADKPVNPSGKIAKWGDGLFELQLDVGTAGADPGGVSGAPVFVDERVVGILIESRGNSGGLLAIDAASILKSWPAQEPRPAPVPYKVPYERWVAQALAGWLADIQERKVLAGQLTDLDPNDVTPTRLARVLMTSRPEDAVKFVKRSITGADRDQLIDLCCSLWVHQGAANSLGEVLYGRKEPAVLRFKKPPPVLDHLCCAEGLNQDGLPLCRDGTLPVTYLPIEPDEDALWTLVKAEIVKLDPDSSSSSDMAISAAVNASFVAIAVEGQPPRKAIEGLRDRQVAIPIVTFSETANKKSAETSGGVLIEPFADPDREQAARVLWARRRSGGGTG